MTENGKVVFVANARRPFDHIGNFNFLANAGNPTLNVYTNNETIRDVTNGKLTLIEAVEQGKIRYEGIGFINKIKISILDVLFRLSADLAKKVKR